MRAPRGLMGPTLGAFGLAVVLTVAIFALLFSAEQNQADATAQARRSERTVFLSSRLQRLTIDLETGIRGRLLARDDRYLAPYRAAIAAIPGILDRLEAPSSGPSRRRVDRLSKGVELYVSSYARPEAARPLDSSFAELRAATAEGKRRLDSLRRLFTGFQTTELRLSASAARRAGESADRSLMFAGAGLVLSILLLMALAAYVLRRVLVPVRDVAASADRLASGERRRGRLSGALVQPHGRCAHRERARAPRRPQAGRGRFGHEVRLPGQHEPRDPHASQRSDRYERAAPGHRPRLRATGVRAHRADVGGGAAWRDQRHLDISKIEAGQLEVERSDFNLLDVVETSADIAAVAAREKELDLTVYMHDEVPRAVRGDSVRLAQVLTNLLSNAVKFTPAGEVALEVQVEGGEGQATMVRFSVRDSGIGIDPDRLEQLFEAFTQADVSTTRRYGGSGLGLAICRELVTLMGGHIEAQSVRGEGSTFSFVLPLALALAEPTTMPSRTELRGLRVLAVDDHATNRRILEAYLAAWGMRAEKAVDGPQALELMHEAVISGEPFDLAILDYNMPDMDGAELARRISAAPALRATRMILLASTTAGHEPARRAGVLRVLTKPVRQSRLYDEIAAAMAMTPQRPAPQEPAQLAEPSAASGALVLIAEDQDVNRLLAERLLERRGHRTVAAGDGQEVLELLSRERPDLVLMDCQMPELDGYDTTREIRSRESEHDHARVPIVAMTANAMEGDRERCLAAGMDDYLAKPLRLDDLDTVLGRWLPRRDGKAEPRSEDVLDLGRLEDLERDFNPELTRELIESFLDTSPALVAQVVAASRGSDHQAAVEAAHRLRGGCLALGARLLIDACRALEPPDADLSAGAAALERAWRLTEPALRARVVQFS